MTEFGKTPHIPAERFAKMGYSIVIYPLSVMRMAMGHVARGLAALKRDGSVRSVLSEMQTRKELYELLDYTPGRQWDYPFGRRKT
jgi:methylisocitrate lyase